MSIKWSKQRTVSGVLMLAAGATLVIGSTILLFPDWLVSIFDGKSGTDFHFVRYIGTALIGFSVMNWIYSTFNNLRMVLPAIYGNLTSLGLAIVIDVWGLIAGSLAPEAIVILAVHTVFATLFLYAAKVIHE